MKRTILSFAALLLCTASYMLGQDFWDDSKKHWADGPLTLDDFDQRTIDSTEAEQSCLAWNVDLNRSIAKDGNFRFDVVKSEAVMDRLLSWYSSNLDPSWALRYNQASFDRVEVIRRKMQNDFNANPTYTSNVYDYYKRLFQNELEKFEQESKKGTDTLAIIRMEEQNRKDLESYEEAPVRTPNFQKPRWGLGGWVGYGGDYYFAPVAAGITMTNAFEYGFTLECGQMTYELGMMMGGCGRLKKDNFFYDDRKDYEWEKGRRCSGGSAWLAGGYRLVDGPYLAVRPTIGLGAGFLDQSDGNVSSEIAGFRLMAGAVFSYKYKRRFDTVDLGYRESCVNFRLFGSRTDFRGLGETYSITFGVNLSLTEWVDLNWL
ncbi:MAG: hypothetical protein J5698_02505 [Bacteroidaceae bacterium]|nr:hypothetical protein [Bacteroidaceae bacterium]